MNVIVLCHLNNCKKINDVSEIEKRIEKN